MNESLIEIILYFLLIMIGTFIERGNYLVVIILIILSSIVSILYKDKLKENKK